MTDKKIQPHAPKSKTAPVKPDLSKTSDKGKSDEKEVKLNFKLPETAEFLKAGVHFGHQKRRWDPKMSEYIYTQRGGIHVIDLSKTQELLENALKFLVHAASKGDIIFVGTKRQGRSIVREAATEAGVYFVTHRWVGGLFTNFNYIRRSLKRLNKLEEAFEEGIEGRTKFEVSRMKKDWERLNRLYEGVKALDGKPTAIVVLDCRYERNAVEEARRVGVPVVAIVDTNSDPNTVNYPIPANDDAVGSITLLFDLFIKAIRQGSKGKKVEHKFKDYTKVEVKIRKVVKKEAEVKEVLAAKETKPTERPAVVRLKKVKRKKGSGIFEQVQKKREAALDDTPGAPKKGKPGVKKASKEKPKPKKSAELSSRTQKALDTAKMSVEKVQALSDEDALKIKGIGKKALEEIRSV